MICQFCGKHEANNKFVVSFAGQEKEVFICDECLKNFSHFAGMPGRQHTAMPDKDQEWGSFPTWAAGFKISEENDGSEKTYNRDDGLELRMKRRLNQLHIQLKHAIETERYEDAAVLRDKINTIKNEVFINGK